MFVRIVYICFVLVFGNTFVFYSETREKELLDRATQDVVRHFSAGKLFRAESVFIATWHQVARKGNTTDDLVSV